jgi:hypothetical protein
MPNKTKPLGEIKEEYLSHKIGLVNATIAGALIGTSMIAKQYGRDYHYDDGKRIRA